MPSRERRMLDKDKEIRKLKSTAGHYFNCTIDGAIKIYKLKKALDVAVNALKSIQEYGAIAMSELQKNGLGGFQKPVSKMQDMAHLAEKQINEITKGLKDENR